MEERRIFTRISVKLPLKFLDLNSGKKGEAETLDISANGIGFVTKEILPAKTPLEIWLIIPDYHEPLYNKGEVVWSYSFSNGNQQRVGVHFKKENFIGAARALWAKHQEDKI